jgi:hypothetical protein
MSKLRKIAIISTHSFGYIDFLVDKLNQNDNVVLTYINIDAIPFKYKNFFSKVYNLILKLLKLPNLKEQNRADFIFKIISGKDKFDQILIIRPDKFQMKTLEFLKGNTDQLTCYLFDGIENFKNQKKTLSFFNKVFSYDKKDVEKFNFEFITNYIYDDTIHTAEMKHEVFNISSYDKRFGFIEKLANYLSENNISFQFIIRKEQGAFHENIQFVRKYLSICEVKNYIAENKVLVDIQKENQTGLSFRIFEALGYDKKIITNNEDIVRYDFYNPNNICVISEDNINIPATFFESEYEKLEPEIVDKYKLKNWIYQVFNVVCD